jgi:hypothetical protein
MHQRKVLAKKIDFLGKTFYGCPFYEDQIYIFEINMGKQCFGSVFIFYGSGSRG